MTSCDMCGRPSELTKVFVEGTELEVCTECTKFGKVISPPKIAPKARSKFARQIRPRRKEIVENVIPNFSNKIKNARNKLNLKQSEFATKLAVKESIIQKIEAGNFTPSIPLAKRFEKILKTKLVEIEEESNNTHLPTEKKSNGPFTIADFVKK